MKLTPAIRAALTLISCTACASVRTADANMELDALRAENARLSAEAEAQAAEAAGLVKDRRPTYA